MPASQPIPSHPQFGLLGLTLFAAATSSLLLPAAPVRACGGFFCNTTPVDQNAERILFVVEDGKTVMIPQIQYQGDAEDFAWVVPVPEVPEDRDVFPQVGLINLDQNSGPMFDPDPECDIPVPEFAPTALADGGGADEGGVTVFVQEQVGPFEVAVIGGEDPEELAQWLRDNGYRISDAMDPYIARYTELDMKFLALKLQSGKDVSDIEPFKMTFSGENPSVPLILTRIAAEPEMSILVWIFSDQRFEPANAAEVEVDQSKLRWRGANFRYTAANTNWTTLVAKAVDEVDGQGWVVEQAGDADNLRSSLQNTFLAPEQMEDQQKLVDLIAGSSYFTRLHTRVSPLEMGYDPIFRRSVKGDVERVRRLPYVEGLCSWDSPTSDDPCDFTTCGAFGLCRTAELQDGGTVTGCACAPGFTARATFAPDSSQTVICQDKRLSFMNPGDEQNGTVLPDPCATFDCGPEGTCISMNMTPTCECPMGKIARGWFDSDGTRRGSCVTPKDAIPASFYNRRPPEDIGGLPMPVEVEVPEPSGMTDMELEEMGIDPLDPEAMPPGNDPLTPAGPGSDEGLPGDTISDSPAPGSAVAGDPAPGMESGSCSLNAPGKDAPAGGTLLALLAAAALLARRRRS